MSCLRPTLDQIIDEVARHYALSRAELISKRRWKEWVRPRHLAMYIAYKTTDESLSMIGGGRSARAITQPSCTRLRK